MSKKLKSLVVKVEGFRMHLDHFKRGISSALWGQGYREPCFMWIVRKEAVGDLGLDIGANLGYVTLHMCKNLKRVMAIEPDDNPRELLKRSLKENNLRDKVDIRSFAISNKDGEATIYIGRKNSNLNSLCSGKKLKSKKDLLCERTIKTVKIDSLNISPNFVKMDIEGFEVEAIEGGMETFERVDNCKILIEVHPQYYNEERKFNVTLDNLFKIGFRVKYVVSAGCECPDMFKERNYKPFKVLKDGVRNRGIFKNVSEKDAIDFCSFEYPIKTEGSVKVTKVARSILLVKGEK